MFTINKKKKLQEKEKKYHESNVFLAISKSIPERGKAMEVYCIKSIGDDITPCYTVTSPVHYVKDLRNNMYEVHINKIKYLVHVSDGTDTTGFCIAKDVPIVGDSLSGKIFYWESPENYHINSVDISNIQSVFPLSDENVYYVSRADGGHFYLLISK